MKLTKKKQVAVVGGGITGLVAAHSLLSLGENVQVTLFEQSLTGGKITSGNIASIEVDLGPDSFIAKRTATKDLAVAIGLEHYLVEPASNDFDLWLDKSLIAYPKHTYLGIPNDPIVVKNILSKRGFKDLKADLRAKKHTGEDLTIQDLLEPRIGREALNILVEPLAAGIHAGSASTLGVAATNPELLAAAVGHGSLIKGLKSLSQAREPTELGVKPEPLFLGIKGGINKLTDALLNSLIESDDFVLNLGTQITNIVKVGNQFRVVSDPLGSDTSKLGEEHLTHIEDDEISQFYDGIIVALGPHNNSQIFSSISSVASNMLDTVKTASVSVVTLALPIDTMTFASGKRGYLVPRIGHEIGKSRRIPITTAVTYMSEKWPHLKRDGLGIIRISCGRIDDTRHLQLDDNELIKEIKLELELAVQKPIHIADKRVTRWLNAFPQYEPDHLLKSSKIRSAIEETGNITIASSALGGIGIGSRIDDAVKRSVFMLKRLQN